jgi:ERCC4-related helicase
MREVPKANYSKIPEWVQAVKREVDEVLLPRARAEMDSPDYLAAKAAEFITTDRILEDLALEERLDTMVDRAMRRLAQMKFMKQISRSDERQLRSATALQIEGPKKPKRQKNKK